MKKIRFLFLLLFGISSLFAQEAQLEGEEGEEGENLLVWPFADSYPINYTTGSHGWSMVNGAGGGLHKNSDYFALDWLRPNAPTCGIDFYAPLSGTVIWTEGNNPQGYGKQVIIQSDQDTNYAFRIAHLESYSVARGQKVKAGDLIAKIGDTGNGPCHGHLALYRNIYDRVDLPKTKADSAAQTALRAIDQLQKGWFITSQASDRTYFAAPFRFLPGEEGLDLLRFHTHTQQVGDQDSVEARIQLVNKGTTTWSGTLNLTLQTHTTFNPYQGFSPNRTEAIKFVPGDTIDVILKKSVFGNPPGTYSLYLGLLSRDTIKGVSSGLEVVTLLGQTSLDIYSSNLCQQNEPNDQLSLATALFEHPLKAAIPEKIKQSFISTSDDIRDIYSFSSQKRGRFNLKNLGKDHFEWQISTTEGIVKTKQYEREMYFYTEPGIDYFLTVEGPSSCLEPYRFSYSWIPINALEWTLQITDDLVHIFEVIQAVEVEWMLIDMLGRRIWQSGKRNLNKGNHQFTDQVPIPQSGIYNVVLLIDGQLVDQRRFYWNKE